MNENNEAIILSNMREALTELIEDLAEKRSDIADILESILDDEEGRWKNRNVYKTEHRFITCNVPTGSILAQYDTLTTEISFSDLSDTWQLGKGYTYE